MDFAGIAYHSITIPLGEVTAVESNGFLWCALSVNGEEYIRFPMAVGTLQAEVELRMSNVINQTGLVSGVSSVVL